MAIEINGDTGISGVNGSATTPAIQGTDTNTGLSFGTDEVNVVTGGSTRATVDSSGRLLVGTTTASTSGVSKLFQVVDSAGASIGLGRTSGSPIANGEVLGGIDFLGAGLAPGAYIRCVANGEQGSTTDLPSDLTFATTPNASGTNVERMRISRDGHSWFSPDSSYFGNQNTPFSSFDQTLAQWVFGLRNQNSDPAGLIIDYSAASPNNGANNFLLCADTGGTRARIKSNGGLTNYQGNNSNLCDEREKKNIVDLDSTWNCLKSWELKKFHYNDDADDSDLRYGVIAQQVALHCPEVIDDWVKQEAADAVLDEDGNEVEPAREEITRLAVKEQQMYWMAIKALQEAQTRIEQLETRLTALEGGTN